MKTILFLLCVGSRLVSAVTIDDARLARDLDPARRATAVALDIVERDAALTVGEYHHQSDLRTARVFARLLHARAGTMVSLQATLRGQPAPGFNGRLYDARDTLVANLKLTEDRHALADTPAYVARLVDKARRYGEVHAWRRYLLKYVRTLGGHTRNADVGAVELEGDVALAHYEFLLANTRKLMSLFAPGSARPTWILLNVLESAELTPAALAEIAALSALDPRVPVVMILQENRITTFRAGTFHVERLAPCETALAPEHFVTHHEFSDVARPAHWNLPRPLYF